MRRSDSSPKLGEAGRGWLGHCCAAKKFDFFQKSNFWSRDEIYVCQRAESISCEESPPSTRRNCITGSRGMKSAPNIHNLLDWGSAYYSTFFYGQIDVCGTTLNGRGPDGLRRKYGEGTAVYAWPTQVGRGRDWGLGVGIGDWGAGIQIPNPQSPIPIPPKCR